MLYKTLIENTKKDTVIHNDTIAFTDSNGRHFNKQGEEVLSVTDSKIDSGKSYISLKDNKGRKQIIGESRK